MGDSADRGTCCQVRQHEFNSRDVRGRRRELTPTSCSDLHLQIFWTLKLEKQWLCQLWKPNSSRERIRSSSTPHAPNHNFQVHWASGLSWTHLPVRRFLLCYYKNKSNRLEFVWNWLNKIENRLKRQPVQVVESRQSLTWSAVLLNHRLKEPDACPVHK